LGRGVGGVVRIEKKKPVQMELGEPEGHILSAGVKEGKGSWKNGSGTTFMDARGQCESPVLLMGLGGDLTRSGGRWREQNNSSLRKKSRGTAHGWQDWKRLGDQWG